MGFLKWYTQNGDDGDFSKVLHGAVTFSPFLFLWLGGVTTISQGRIVVRRLYVPNCSLPAVLSWYKESRADRQNTPS